MKPTRKQIAYGVVLAGSTALLIAQVLERRSRPKLPSTVERGALDDGSSRSADLEPGPSELSAGVIVTIDGAPRASAAAAAEAAPPPTDGDGVPAVAPEHDPQGVLDRLEASLADLHNLSTVSRRPNLDRLARGWAKSRVEPPLAAEVPATVFAPAPPAPEAAETSGGEDKDAKPAPTSDPAADVLMEFLSSNPLCGIVAGAGDSAAMFGGRIVRAGDQLVSGDAFVQAIERRAVLVKYRQRDVRIELPPFRPRPRPDDGESSGAAATGPGTAASSDAGAAAQTAAEAAPSSATDKTPPTEPAAASTTESKDATKKE